MHFANNSTYNPQRYEANFCIIFGFLFGFTLVGALLGYVYCQQRKLNKRSKLIAQHPRSDVPCVGSETSPGQVQDGGGTYRNPANSDYDLAAPIVSASGKYYDVALDGYENCMLVKKNGIAAGALPEGRQKHHPLGEAAGPATPMFKVGQSKAGMAYEEISLVPVSCGYATVVPRSQRTSARLSPEKSPAQSPGHSNNFQLKDVGDKKGNIYFELERVPDDEEDEDDSDEEADDTIVDTDNSIVENDNNIVKAGNGDMGADKNNHFYYNVGKRPGQMK